MPSLKWAIQKEINIVKIRNQSTSLLLSPASLQQKIKILNTIIHGGIKYDFYSTFFLFPTSRNWINSPSNLQNPHVTSPKTLLSSLPSYPAKCSALKHSSYSQDMPLYSVNNSSKHSTIQAH